jgi:hypothetical protein
MPRHGAARVSDIHMRKLQKGIQAATYGIEIAKVLLTQMLGGSE